MLTPLLNGVLVLSQYNISSQSDPPQRSACSPLLDSVMLIVAGSQSDALPSLSACVNLSTKREHSGELFHQDTQPQLDAGRPFLIDTEISSCGPPLALPQCSTRWYSIVKSETVAARGREGGRYSVLVCASVCLRVSSD